MPKITYFPVKNFRGVESKISPIDAGRGGMIKMEGCLPQPWWDISSGPSWFDLFSTENMGAAIDAAMQSAGLDATKLHFATVANDHGQTLLIAWDRFWKLCLGIWQVDQLNEIFDPGLLAHITVNGSSAWNNYTSGVCWFGEWVGQSLWIGNGTDVNLVYDGLASTLSVLGPVSPPANPSDPSQVRVPPFAAIARFSGGEVFCASCNSSNYPLRVYITEPPNADFPIITGLKSAISSFVDIVASNGARITALQVTELGIVAHLTIGPPVLLDKIDGVDDGWRANQRPLTSASSGSLNQNCAPNTPFSPLYLGSDYELYRKDGDELVTAKSKTFWNLSALREAQPLFTRQPMVLFDRRSNRAWVGMPTVEDGTMGWWAWNVDNNAISGPIRYPNFTAATMARTNTIGASIAIGMTSAGALLYADLNLSDQPVLPDPYSPLDVPYQQVTTPPTPSLSIPYVGINKCGNGWTQTKEGQTLHLPSPWADAWVLDPQPSQTVTPIRWLNNAYLAIIELLEEDFGTPVMRKNILELREQWRRNQLAYLGAFIEVDGNRDGQWMGCAWSNLEQVCHVNLTGTRMRLRIIIAFFNDQQAILPDLTVGYYPVAPR